MSELCKEAGIDTDPLLDYVNDIFLNLLEKHDNDVKFDHPERHTDIYPEDEQYVCVYHNALDELLSYDKSFEDIFDYEFGAGNNKWDVGIVRI